MKKIVLIKEGDYRANLFSDFAEFANNDVSDVSYVEQAMFFSRMDYSMRLIQNRSDVNPEMPLAIGHFLIDPNAPDTTAKFRPLDTGLMMTALETYGFVMLALIHSSTSENNDYTVIRDAKYVARDASGNLIDIETDTRVNLDPASDVNVGVTTLCAMVKFGTAPVYYIITDPHLLKPSDVLDVYDSTNDVNYVMVTDHDGTVKENVFNPTFSDNVTQVGKYNLMVTGTSMTIDLLGPTNLYATFASPAPTFDVVVDSNYAFTRTENTFTFDIVGQGYVKLNIQGGEFFDMSQRKEHPTFEYMIQTM